MYNPEKVRHANAVYGSGFTVYGKKFKIWELEDSTLYRIPYTLYLKHIQTLFISEF